MGVFEDERLVSHAEVTTALVPREGYASEVEESISVDIDDNRLRVIRGGYRAGKDWSHESVYRLSPLGVVYEASSSGDAITAADWQQRWDWSAFRGGELMFEVQCDDDSPPGEQVLSERAHLYIPIMRLPAGYREGGWKRVSPGSCAVSLDAENALPKPESGLELDDMSVPPGFITHGAPNSENDKR